MVDHMTTMDTACPFGPGFDFTDPDVLLAGIPVTEFAELRKTAPVWWNEQAESIFDDGGYWVISRHEDIKAISKNSDLWSTNRKGAVMRLPDGITPDQLELTKALLINHDAPEHTRLRKLVSRLFTPRAVADAGGEARRWRRARSSPAAARKGSGNFVDDIAMQLPLQAIADLHRGARGRPGEAVPLDELDHEHRRPRFRHPTRRAANAELMGYAYTMAEQRRRCPADDIVTRLVQADVDGDWIARATSSSHSS